MIVDAGARLCEPQQQAILLRVPLGSVRPRRSSVPRLAEPRSRALVLTCIMNRSSAVKVPKFRRTKVRVPGFGFNMRRQDTGRLNLQAAGGIAVLFDAARAHVIGHA